MTYFYAIQVGSTSDSVDKTDESEQPNGGSYRQFSCGDLWLMYMLFAPCFAEKIVNSTTPQMKATELHFVKVVLSFESMDQIRQVK